MSLRDFDARIDDETRANFLDLPDDRFYRTRLWLETRLESLDYAMATGTANEAEVAAFKERVDRYKATRGGSTVHPVQLTDGRIFPGWNQNATPANT